MILWWKKNRESRVGKYEKLLTGVVIGGAIGSAIGIGMRSRRGRELGRKLSEKTGISRKLGLVKRVGYALIFGKKKK